MPILEGGQILAKSLKQEGVEYLFTLCGGTIESIYDGCLREDIKIIDVRVDQSATMMGGCICSCHRESWRECRHQRSGATQT